MLGVGLFSGSLGGGIAHDFNNILTAIIGFADILAHNLDFKDKNQLDIQEINLSRDAQILKVLK